MQSQPLEEPTLFILADKKRIVLEVLVVLGVMLLVKDLADRFNAIGAGSIAMWCGIFVATYFMNKQGVNWKDRGLALPSGSMSWVKALGLAILTVVAVLLLMALVVPLISDLLGAHIPESSTDRFEFFLGQPLVFVAYLVVVIWIGAAVGEELLMRGFLLNSLIELFGGHKKGITAAVALHALIFGMLHISQGVPGIIGTAGVAVIFAVVYLFNGKKLFPLIIAHGLINSISITAYYLSDGKIT
ncbi:CPBP family intramembrane glutamic endopeptidase [Congregibacter litoralis]|uniref:CAAX protease self-immunity n=1 Tax=Congregibacter litoralis KT71 TaxID=314285 RepID=A4AAY2_9GAMM|nr:CPBP family intramembrane glutamic endopeptidase [Congregibacter litoralis]EAQ96854.1 CAAX protease self-immunity [Congregibacter litoralis KT71]